MELRFSWISASFSATDFEVGAHIALHLQYTVLLRSDTNAVLYTIMIDTIFNQNLLICERNGLLMNLEISTV